jgi:hypothetical protein
MEAVAKHQGTEFKFGDVLIVRSGFTEDLGGMNAQEQEQAMSTHKAVGVEGSEEVAKWVWNHHFASVAGDALAFEVLPPTLANGEIGRINDLGKSNTAFSYVRGWETLFLSEGWTNSITQSLVLHQYFLSLFGLNIGELWDLKALSEQCKKAGRYSFLLTSIPLNVQGAIGSPPNALAIF